LLPNVLAVIASFCCGVRAYQTEPLFPHAVGSSEAEVAPVVSALSVNGRALITVALLKSSFAAVTVSAAAWDMPAEAADADPAGASNAMAATAKMTTRWVDLMTSCFPADHPGGCPPSPAEAGGDVLPERLQATQRG